ERRELLELYGADVVDSPGDQGSNGAIRLAQELASDPRYYMPYQYGNPANPGAHYDGTGAEIVRDLGSGAVVVRARVGRISVLVGHVVAGVAGQLLGQPDRPIRALIARRVDHVGAVELEQLAAL